MIPLQGKYNSAKVFTDNVDSETIGQIINFLNLECIKDAKIRIMPDCHAGKNCVVGTTMTITDNVIPGMIGVDIGCGMYAIKLEEVYTLICSDFANERSRNSIRWVNA